MKKFIAYMVALSIVFSTVVFCASPAYALEKKSVAEGTYVIYSKLDGSKVIDINDGSKKSGANVQLWKYNGSEAQQFEIKKSGSYYTIKSKCSGLLLDVKGGSKSSGANVQQYKANNTDSQKWEFYDAGGGYVYLKCKVGSMALDVKGGKTANGTNIQMYKPNATDSQKWMLKKVSAKKDDNNDSYSKKVNAFLSDKRWKDGAKWTGSQMPKISSQTAWGCCAYAADFSKYVFNKKAITDGKKFSNLKDIRAGDVIKVTNTQHWFVVLERNGNKLKTAEGNWVGKVVVSNGVYTISGNKLKRNGKTFRTFAAGYHMQ